MNTQPKFAGRVIGGEQQRLLHVAPQASRPLAYSRVGEELALEFMGPVTQFR